MPRSDKEEVEPQVQEPVQKPAQKKKTAKPKKAAKKAAPKSADRPKKSGDAKKAGQKPGQKKRSNISKSAVKRLLGEGAVASRLGKKARISLLAIQQAKYHSESLLHTLANHVNRYMEIAQKKNIGERVLKSVVVNDLPQLGFNEAMITHARKENTTQRGLSRTGVLRQFRANLTTTTRMSPEGKGALVNLLEMYLHKLGERSASFALAGKRLTVMRGDVDSAAHTFISS